MVSHQIAVQSQQRQRTARAAYLAIADIMVCMLSDALVLQLGVSTSARSVVLSRASQRHIVARRAIARSGDAQLAADQERVDGEDVPRWWRLDTNHKRFEAGR